MIWAEGCQLKLRGRGPKLALQNFSTHNVKEVSAGSANQGAKIQFSDVGPLEFIVQKLLLLNAEAVKFVPRYHRFGSCRLQLL